MGKSYWTIVNKVEIRGHFCMHLSGQKHPTLPLWNSDVQHQGDRWRRSTGKSNSSGEDFHSIASLMSQAQRPFRPGCILIYHFLNQFNCCEDPGIWKQLILFGHCRKYLLNGHQKGGTTTFKNLKNRSDFFQGMLEENDRVNAVLIWHRSIRNGK